MCPPRRAVANEPVGLTPVDALAPSAAARIGLQNRIGLTDEQLAGMSRLAAIERARQYWMTGK